MITTLIFDIQCGVSGDMIVGSMLDLGVDHRLLSEELEKLDLPGWRISPEKTNRYGLSGYSAGITATVEDRERNLNDIRSIINKSRLSYYVKETSLNVFTRLAEAEARVHNQVPDTVHFHETGAVDSIVDIVAFSIVMEMLGVKEIYFTEFCFGTGTVRSQHGELPVPVPAVVELTRGFRVRYTERRGELVTPTGAAILTALGTQITAEPSFTLVKNGTGFGTRPYPFPSYTRAMLVEKDDITREEIYQIEVNIDDMNPQIYPYLMEEVFKKGALDMYITPIVMKKGRPGSLITILATSEAIDSIKESIYRETTSLGIRYFKVSREKLQREYTTVNLGRNSIRIKTGYYKGNPVNVQPEFDDCKKTAENSGHPLKEIFRKARNAFTGSEGA